MVEKELDKNLILIAKTSVIILFGILASKILAYAYRILIARAYSPEVYGLYAISVMIVSWFTVFSSMGINQGLLRYLSYYHESRKKVGAYLFQKSIKILFFAGVISSFILFIFSETISAHIFNNAGLSIFLKIFSISIVLDVVSGTFLSSLKATQHIKEYSFVSNIFGNVTRLVVLAVLILSGFNSGSISISYVLGSFSILASSFLFLKIKENYLFEKTNEHKKSFAELFSYSKPLVFFGFISSILYSIDSFILGIFSGAEAVGFYNAAVPIALLLTLSKDLFAHLFFPLVTQEYAKKNFEEIKQLSKQVVKWTYILVLPIFIWIFLFPGFFLNFLFGEKYLVAENALRILVIGTLFLTVFDINKELLLMKGKSKMILKCILLVSILNTLLNIVLIPRYGINGAAIATTISLVLLSLLFFFLSKKELSVITLKRKMVNITLYSLILTFATLAIKEFYFINNAYYVILAGIIFICIYALTILFGGCLDEHDKLVLEKVKEILRR